MHGGRLGARSEHAGRAGVDAILIECCILYCKEVVALFGEHLEWIDC
jgi:hypothetical protein